MSSILIVDDEEAVCWTLQRALSREGHEVRTAASGEGGRQVDEQARAAYSGINNKYVRGNAAGQFRRDAFRTFLTCHPHTVVGR